MYKGIKKYKKEDVERKGRLLRNTNRSERTYVYGG
jgi:hypothetical protein